jgi:3-hydroxyisobutyrate dehydrogenase-like beta-hydroxyacid dehydrogenase
VKIGFIGLGLMGEPMAARLLAAGHELVVTSRRRVSADSLVSAGASWAATAAACAHGRDLVILMLPDAPSIEQVVFAEAGILAADPLPRAVVDMSTTSPVLTARIAAALGDRGAAVFDAPVSGGPAGAQAGTLTIMAGGDQDAYPAVEPALAQLGRPRLLGPAGTGQRVKLVNQVLIANYGAGIAEAWALGRQLGLDPATVHAVVSGGLAAGPLLDFMWPRLEGGDFAPGFKIDQMIKDLSFVAAEADRHGLQLATTLLTLARYQRLSALGAGERGTQALALHENMKPSLDATERI